MGNRQNSSRNSSHSYAGILLLSPKSKIVNLREYVLYDTEQNGSFLFFKDYKELQVPASMQSPFYLYKNSLKIVECPDSPLVGIRFCYSSVCQVSISVYFFVVEYIDIKKKKQIFCLESLRSPEPVEISGIEGEQLEIITPRVLDFQLFTENELKFVNKTVFPLCIVINNQNYCMVLYCKFEGKSIIKVRETLVSDFLSYQICDTYVIDADNCVICLSEPNCVLLIPCRHICLCERCLKHMVSINGLCPICRTFIRLGYKIYN